MLYIECSVLFVVIMINEHIHGLIKNLITSYSLYRIHFGYVSIQIMLLFFDIRCAYNGVLVIRENMPKLKLKCMKMVVSEPAPNNGTRCDAGVGVRMSNTSNSNSSASLGSNRSAPTLYVATHCSVPSSSADSNHNEQVSNQNNSTRIENVPAVNEAENLNAIDRNGQKKRGLTTLKDLWSLPPEERIMVSANHLGQPIGPEAQLLAGFLGMLARTGQQIGIQYESWHKVPKKLKDKLFKFIELRFALDISKEYVLKSLGKKWRDYKHDLKKCHFKREDGLQVNKDKHPNTTIRWQWEQLVDYWYSNKGVKDLELLAENNKNILIHLDQRSLLERKRKRKWRLTMEEK
ncbi:uncharacterized protein LOC120254922 isoform X2 [Dioscorea cayenensis subsp. rotundata]|uniref:Uncharacterized protein LOC120254922 isoform X2 n=1 Tax=Dioscorea cayennensis subsp. rotundata TaxID=55577 RepID=A0AB40AV08_DIOCR|nr:uncharacterized protein LOC120254922 isoform X2 [Dioscorea cayenensis subsp. rotundata]